MRKKKNIKPAIKSKASPVVKPSQPTDLEYIKLFEDCVIDKTKVGDIDKVIDDNMVANKAIYTKISDAVAGKVSLNPPVSFFSFTPNLQGAQNDFFSLRSPESSDLLAMEITKNPFQFKNPFDTAFVNFGTGSSNIPWYFIACAHYLECSFSFKKHLHNGDPLTSYTVRVPANRPKVGHEPPFTFEESAVDALKLMKFDQIQNWNLPTILRKLEAYNGFGYFKFHSINSPYLWSYSNHYTKGKYVADGKFDTEAVSKQLGSAVILKRMEERALIGIARH